MFINKEVYFLFFAFYFSLNFSGFGQRVSQDSLFLVNSLRNASAVYSEATQKISSLYNGSEFVTSDNRVDGHPYYGSEDLEEGNVFYSDKYFESIPLKYDIYLDEVIAEYFNQVYEMRLISDKVGSFSFLGYNFLRLTKDSINLLPKTGFYQVLFDGETKVFAKRKKIIFETIEDRRVSREYIEQNAYFFQKDGVFYGVKTKKAALAPFREYKKELNRALRKNKLKFRLEKEKSLILIASEYDKISRK